MYKNKSVTKALALAIFVKNRIKSSTIQDFSYNKLHLLTGLHINTLKKRLDVLIEQAKTDPDKEALLT